VSTLLVVPDPVAAEETDADGGSGGLRPGTIAPEHAMPTSISYVR